ncbi:MAG: NnrS family protein [Nitrospira defluvii]|nr:NnrS family protein [Nitrospira defluvii]
MKIGKIDHSSDKPASQGPAFFSYGFRPFFLGAALFAGLAIPAWIMMLAGAGDSAVLSLARDWHVHEMVFGFLPAVITGFLLTAIPNWTDRPPIKGRGLMLLFTLWLAGRLVMAMPWFASAVSAIVDGAFLLAVAGLLWRELAAGGSWSHAPVGGVISLYACANIFFHVRALSGAESDLPARMALALIMVLLAIIGGRLTPNFTREFLAGQGKTEQPAPFSHYDGASIILVALAGVAWTVQPQSMATGWLLVAAGSVNLGRLSRWYGWLTWREPLVFVLHWGYGWLALSLLILGCAILGAGLPKEDAVHALTTGAIGVMTLGVMTRASLGHTGRPRHAGPTTLCIYMLVNLGAILRVFGPSTGLPTTLVLGSAALSWSGAYLLFTVVYGPFLLRPSLDE